MSERLVQALKRRTTVALAACVLACLCGAAPSARAQYGSAPTPLPAQGEQEKMVLSAIDFEQRLNEQAPLDVRLVDENGQAVDISRYFGEKPVVLALVYYECPMLCTEILNGLLHTMKELEFSAGREFNVVAVSIDPTETPVMAAEKKAQYLSRYGRDAAAGWHFLTGKEEEVRRLADAVGYKYVYDPATTEYVHPAGIVLLTPSGKISHYFYGVVYDAGDVRLGLVEASESKIGSPVDKLLLYCYHYDPLSGKYNVMAMTIVRGLGILTVILMTIGVYLMLRRHPTAKVPGEKPGLSVQG
jgi:protein SCO1/2